MQIITEGGLERGKSLAMAFIRLCALALFSSIFEYCSPLI